MWHFIAIHFQNTAEKTLFTTKILTKAIHKDDHWPITEDKICKSTDDGKPARLESLHWILTRLSRSDESYTVIHYSTKYREYPKSLVNYENLNTKILQSHTTRTIGQFLLYFDAVVPNKILVQEYIIKISQPTSICSLWKQWLSVVHSEISTLNIEGAQWIFLNKWNTKSGFIPIT